MPARHLIDLEPVPEHAFLVAVDTGEDAGWSAVDSLAELAALATTAGAEPGITWLDATTAQPTNAAIGLSPALTA